MDSSIKTKGQSDLSIGKKEEMIDELERSVSNIHQSESSIIKEHEEQLNGDVVNLNKWKFEFEKNIIL